MTSPQQMITGVLRKWQRSGPGIRGYVYESDIWDDGEEAFLFPGEMVESVNFYLWVMNTQTYKLPKDEEIKNGYSSP